MSNEIDYLFEDPPISNQKFALVSIVGPHLKQKCDVWGIKFRGSYDTLEEAKKNVSRLMRIDANYDVYIVEVGKFFPLAVDPLAMQNVEYQNQQLNEMMKSYLQNKELANEEWLKRKQELVQDAIKEGQNPTEKDEHPVALLSRLQDYEEKFNHFQSLLQQAKETFDNLPLDAQENAKQVLSNSPSLDGNVSSILEQLKLVDDQLQNESLSDLEKHDLVTRKKEYMLRLEDGNVSAYINDKMGPSSYEF